MGKKLGLMTEEHKRKIGDANRGKKHGPRPLKIRRQIGDKLRGSSPRIYRLAEYNNGPRLLAIQLAKGRCRRCKNMENILVHHRNEDTNDQRQENLEVLCQSCHFKHHMKIYREKNGRCGAAKLNKERVREIRELFSTGKYTQRALAERFGLIQQTISQIVLFKTWKSA